MKVKQFKNDYRVEKPKCYNPNTDPYHLCKGARHPQEFAENDCIHCCLYESMADEGGYSYYDK